MAQHLPDRFGNLLLSRLQADDLLLIRPLLERVTPSHGEHLVVAGTDITHNYFLETGVASIISARSDDVRVEIAVVGYEGVIGSAALLGAGGMPQNTVIQVDHAFGWRIETSALRRLFDQSKSLRDLLLRYIQTLIVQISSNAAANISDRLDARLSRWLLMCHDRVEGNDIAITHGFMATMIGAPRTAVTGALHILEGAGLIRSRRGLVTIIDRDGLEAMAGPGYGAAEQEYRRLIGQFGKTGEAISADVTLTLS